LNKLNCFPFPKLKTERLVLRELKESDKKEIFSLRTNVEVNKFISRPKPKNIEEVCKWINDNILNNGSDILFYWAITLKDTPKLIGDICLWNFSDDNLKAEIGYELASNFQKKGIMQEALQGVIKFAFSSLHLGSIDAYTHKDNINSINLLVKNNFKKDLERKDIEDCNNIIFTIDKLNFIN
jgi:ribosomal-protein-alanine N-acetyltransferase